MAGSEKTTSAEFRYVRNDKNQILEQMKHYATLKANDAWFRSIDAMVALLVGMYPYHTDSAVLTHYGISLFERTVRDVSSLYRRLFRVSYLLSKAADVEGLARQNNKKKHELKSSNDHLKSVGHDTFLGGSIEERLHAMAYRQVTNLVDAYQRARMQKISVDEIRTRLAKALPPQSIYRINRLRKLKEARADIPETGTAIDVDAMPDDEWEEVLSLYEDTMQGYREDQRLKNDMGVMEFTDLEREANEEFVSQVRSGEVDAANENGIDDFVWISVIDSKTCEECCIPRDGLTTKEIEKKLDNEWANMECDAVTPPAHPNCRCQIAPIDTDKMDQVDVPYQSVEDWLNS